MIISDIFLIFLDIRLNLSENGVIMQVDCILR